MNFSALLGNEELKHRLAVSLSKGHLSHCFLITGPNGSGKHTLAKLLCAAMECAEDSPPCLSCAQCRKVLSEMHPDVITVDEPEKAAVPVKAVREACADLYIRPNEGRRKIYLFPRGENLSIQCQNTLLKCMEEPPEYGTFLILAESAERLLPTIRSRCVNLQLSPLPEKLLTAELARRFPNADDARRKSAARRSEGYLGRAEALLREDVELLAQSEAFLRAYQSGNALLLLRVLTPMEKLKREQLRPILLQWNELLCSALTARSGKPPMHPLCAEVAGARSAAELLNASHAVRKAITMTEANVGPAHICGALFVSLR